MIKNIFFITISLLYFGNLISEDDHSMTEHPVHDFICSNPESYLDPHLLYEPIEAYDNRALNILLSDLHYPKRASKFPVPFEKPSNVSEETWQAVKPYLIPLDHPVRAALDKIFLNSRAITTIETMRAAGFSFPDIRNKRMTCAKHPRLKGYLIKTYLDTHDVKGSDWQIWINRIEGARLIRSTIDKYTYHRWMKVPKKWIYPLPDKHRPAEGPKCFPQHFILVVEDMNILNEEKNRSYYKKKMTRERLDSLFIVLKENLLIDSIYLDNIPFCTDGKIAFIDTEHYDSDKKALRYHRLTPFFSKKMQEYWIKLIENDGPETP